MRVAHGQHCHIDTSREATAGSIDIQRQVPDLAITDHIELQAFKLKRYFGSIQNGGAHVDRDTAIGVHLQFNFALLHFHANTVFGGQAFVAHVAHKASRAIAAVLHLTAIGVVNHIFKVERGVWRRAHRQNLISPHTKMSVGQEAVLGGAEVVARLCFIKHHKIVAGPLHFCKANSHGRIILGSAPPWRKA